MVHFTTTILRFSEQGEKTGWTYILIPVDLAQQLAPGNKKSFRVKGQLDGYRFTAVSLLPMGGGNFIMPLNVTIRKQIRKQKGAMVQVKLEADLKPVEIPEWMTACLDDDPQARDFFNSLARSHRNYFIKWIETAKTEATKTKRIVQAVTCLSKRMDFGAMMRMNRNKD